MIGALKRAVRFCVSPSDEWRVVSREEPRAIPLLGKFVIPLSCIPAGSWALGLYLFGPEAVPELARGQASSITQIAHSASVTFFGSLISVALLAAALALLAPLFGRPRALSRAFQVAAYSSAPVLLAGVVLVVPTLVFALMVAALHSFFLLYGGVHYVLGAKEDVAAEFVALTVMLLILASSLLGAFGGWLGVV